MSYLKRRSEEFRKHLVDNYTREELLEIIAQQENGEELIEGVHQIEYVFSNKLGHLTWNDGSPITERPFSMYELALLVDEPFRVDEKLTELGLSIEEQKEIHVANDPVIWSRHFLKVTPRVYQILMLRDPSLRKVLRAGRRLGKTVTMTIMLLHWAYTHNDARCIVVSPMKAQVEVIYNELLKFAKNSDAVFNSIVRKVSSPQHTVEFSNGSTIKFFTSGMRSGGKADVVRGQEAHLIVLDELDYMHPDDLIALLAMLQKTDKNQADKVLVGASTPTGAQSVFWEWCTNPDGIDPWFKEFWFPAYCFEPGTKITMSNGSYKNIEDIRIGDMVLTENGYQKVLRTFERDYDGKAYDITTYGNNKSLIVTPEHPFSAGKRTRKQSDSYGGKQESINWEWIEAKDLNQSKLRDMNSGNWLQYIYDDTEDAREYIDVLEYDVRFYEHKPGRIKLKRFHDHGRDFKNDFPRYIAMDSSLAYVLGWYMAEGSFDRIHPTFGNPTVTEWTLNSNEEFVYEKMKDILNSWGAGELKKYNREAHKTIRLAISNPVLSTLLMRLAGSGSSTKSLSTRVMTASLSFQKDMLAAYCDGDGWNSENDNYVVRTTSETLARQIQTITARLGYIASISKSELAECIANKDYPPYETQDSWAIQYSPSARSMLGKKLLGNGSGALLIKNKKEIEYTGKVYNFEVENTNSYVANGLLVHNCNPEFTRETEIELRSQYRSEMAYRHEIEADWGEDTEGVYPRRYVDAAFTGSWKYDKAPSPSLDPSHIYVMGVDWDKYGAGSNIVILELITKSHSDPMQRGKIRLIHREEVPRDEYTLTNAVRRIVELNSLFKPAHIYVDRGYGEMQVEMLKKHGIEYPKTELHKRVKGISFSQLVEVRDPHNPSQIDKKEIKPFMVDTLRQILEANQLTCPASDSELRMQLIAYIVERKTSVGRPVFGLNSDKVGDHAHDALILACHALNENYGELLKQRIAKGFRAMDGEIFSPIVSLAKEKETREYQEQVLEEKYGSKTAAPIRTQRSMALNKVKGSSRPFRRRGV